MNENRLLLAWGMAEYDTIIGSIQALDRAGRSVPFGACNAAANDLGRLAMEWHHRYSELSDFSIQRCVREARAYCTDNQTALDQLLQEKGIG